MWTVLKGFHHRAARRMTNMMAYKGPGDKWVYPPLEEALKKAGLCGMEHCVNKRQHRIVDYISTRPIWAHCMDASRKPGTPARTIDWWNQYRGQAKPTDEHWEDGAPCLWTLSFHPPPLAWFWARALNLASILEVKMVVALATLHPLPPSEQTALGLVATKQQQDSSR